MSAAEVEGHVVELRSPSTFSCSATRSSCARTSCPIGTLIRYADNDLLGLHHILVKLVDADEHERMWDAFEDLDPRRSTDAISDAGGVVLRPPYGATLALAGVGRRAQGGSSVPARQFGVPPPGLTGSANCSTRWRSTSCSTSPTGCSSKGAEPKDKEKIDHSLEVLDAPRAEKMIEIERPDGSVGHHLRGTTGRDPSQRRQHRDTCGPGRGRP